VQEKQNRQQNEAKKQKNKFVFTNKKAWITFAVILLLDQITKLYLLHYAVDQIPLFQDYQSFAPNTFILFRITSFFNIVLLFNPGISFSMLSSANEYMPYILSVATLLIIWFLIHIYKTEQNEHNKLFIVMVIAGAVGNLIDRIRYLGVIDFLDFHIDDYRWPAFNVADTFITIGAICWFVNTVLIHKKNA
jgi:signal peptidase II